MFTQIRPAIIEAIKVVYISFTRGGEGRMVSSINNHRAVEKTMVNKSNAVSHQAAAKTAETPKTAKVAEINSKNNPQNLSSKQSGNISVGKKIDVKM